MSKYFDNSIRLCNIYSLQLGIALKDDIARFSLTGKSEFTLPPEKHRFILLKKKRDQKK